MTGVLCNRLPGGDLVWSPIQRGVTLVAYAAGIYLIAYPARIYLIAYPAGI